MMPKPHPAVIFKPVSEGAVLLHTESEIYFGLNHVGAQIWQKLAEASEMELLVAELCTLYPEVDAKQIHDDVDQLLADLAESGLIIPGGVNESPQATS